MTASPPVTIGDVDLADDRALHAAYEFLVEANTVDPALRRRWIGRALLDAVAARARADGRTTLGGLVRRLDPQTPGPGPRFAEAVGARMTGRSLEQVFEWVDRTPQDLLEGGAPAREDVGRHPGRRPP